MKRKMLWFGSLALVVLIAVIGIQYAPSLVDDPQEVRPGMGAGSNTIGFGLTELDGTVIQNGSLLTPSNGQIKKVIGIQHNLNVDRRYGLLVLENYQQVPFKANGAQHTFYEVDMKPNTSEQIEVTVPISADTKELAFLIVKKPEYHMTEHDVEKASILQEVMPLRFGVATGSESPAPLLAKQEPAERVRSGPNDYLFLSKTPDKLKILFQAPPQDSVTLSVGNISNLQEEYAVIALRDWEQVPVFPGIDVFTVQVPPHERAIYPLTLPKAEQGGSNYQLISFPKPFQAAPTDYDSQTAHSTMRTLIAP